MKKFVLLLVLTAFALIPACVFAQSSKNPYLPHTDWLKRTTVYPNRVSLSKLPTKLDHYMGLSASIEHALGSKTVGVGYVVPKSGEARKLGYYLDLNGMYGVLAIYPKAWYYGKISDNLNKKDFFHAEQSSRITCKSNASERLEMLKSSKVTAQAPKINGESWYLGNIIIDKPEFRYEFIPKGQEIHTYQQKYIIEFFGSDFAKNLAEYVQKYDRFNKIFAHDLDLKYYSTVKEHGSDRIIYDWGYGDGYENTYSLIKQTKDGFIRVAITQMTPLTDAEKINWLKILDNEMLIQEQ